MSRTSTSASTNPSSRSWGSHQPAPRPAQPAHIRGRRGIASRDNARVWLYEAISGMTSKYLRTQPTRAILTKLS